YGSLSDDIVRDGEHSQCMDSLWRATTSEGELVLSDGLARASGQERSPLAR
ncbi:hypothetical protein L195_g060683, partial [Trifolium pratense]